MSALRREPQPGSLDARIRDTESRIDERRLAVAGRAGEVGEKARFRLATPWLLVAAAGAGFVFAQFRRKRAREDRREREEKPDVVMKPSIFATISDAITLATTLFAMLPLIQSRAKQGAQEAAGEVPPQ